MTKKREPLGEEGALSWEAAAPYWMVGVTA
jgi:hypothetical protein